MERADQQIFFFLRKGPYQQMTVQTIKWLPIETVEKFQRPNQSKLNFSTQNG
jgi:hypothetical protein